MPKPPRPSTRVIMYWSIFVPSVSVEGSCSFIARIPQQNQFAAIVDSSAAIFTNFGARWGSRHCASAESAG